MIERVIVRRGAYYDSVTLMLVSRAAAGEEGAQDVAVGMATPLNLELLAGQGFGVEDGLGPNDLVIAVRARDEAAAEAAVAAVDRELATKGGAQAVAADRPRARSLASAARRDPALSVAFLSIPGDHVATEAAAALEAGLHVFCFSDGVSVEVEAALKRRAARARSAVHGRRLRHGDHRRRRARLRERGRARAGRHRRRVRHRHPGGQLPARRGGDRRLARDRRRRARPQRARSAG